MVVQGCTQLSLAADGFDYRTQDFATAAKRYFVCDEDEDEDPERWNLQLETSEKYNKQTEIKMQPLIIKKAGHIVALDQPKKYLNTFTKILKKEKILL